MRIRSPFSFIKLSSGHLISLLSGESIEDATAGLWTTKAESASAELGGGSPLPSPEESLSASLTCACLLTPKTTCGNILFPQKWKEPQVPTSVPIREQSCQMQYITPWTIVCSLHIIMQLCQHIRLWILSLYLRALCLSTCYKAYHLIILIPLLFTSIILTIV